jgi:catechol 2,3-dioxygenase-like lactoylglutathione lyase family enzyme
MTPPSYTIGFVSDMDRSIAFYRDALGLPVTHHSHKWTEFGTEGTTIALHLADAASRSAVR